MENATTRKDVASGGHAAGKNIATSDMAVMDTAVVEVSFITLFIYSDSHLINIGIRKTNMRGLFVFNYTELYFFINTILFFILYKIPSKCIPYIFASKPVYAKKKLGCIIITSYNGSF